MDVYMRYFLFLIWHMEVKKKNRGLAGRQVNLKISNSSIGMESERIYTSVRMDAYQYTKAQGFADKGFLSTLKSKDNPSDNDEVDKEEVSKDTDDTLDFLKGKFNELSTIKAGKSFRTTEDMFQKFRQVCINYILSLLMGEKPNDIVENSFNNKGLYRQSPDMYVVQVSKSIEQHYFYESEATSYEAKGKVLTEDGREFDINLQLNMSRSFEEYIESRTDVIDISQMLMDPLVINFDGDIAAVSDQKFMFDLDSDGVKDNVTKLSAGSGFLALDKNEDGVINDGSELFGTKSGDGFSDLAMYDSDHNGWIDENDDIYEKLKIYVLNEDGSETLYRLKDKDIGAIYLGNASTGFSLNNLETNNVNAMIRKTGIFLYENGNVGTIQHVDLGVELGA